MASPQIKRYRVYLYTWDAFKAHVDATSEEEAIAKAHDLYEADGLNPFEHWEDGIDEIVAEETGEAA